MTGLENALLNYELLITGFINHYLINNLINYERKQWFSKDRSLENKLVKVGDMTAEGERVA